MAPSTSRASEYVHTGDTAWAIGSSHPRSDAPTYGVLETDVCSMSDQWYDASKQRRVEFWRAHRWQMLAGGVACACCVLLGTILYGTLRGDPVPVDNGEGLSIPAPPPSPGAPGLLPATDTQANRPRFHLTPDGGEWMNDPNGVFRDPADGSFHVFYQHNPHAPVWEWDEIGWGHFVSADLATWRRLPAALRPHPGARDCSGAWSGAAAVGRDGRPLLIYTGSAKKNSTCEGNDPEWGEYNTEAVWRESILAVSPEQGTEDLRAWGAPVTLLKEPPPPLETSPDLGWEGWRDPFLLRSDGGDWLMLLGTGVSGVGGAIMAYTAADLLGPWAYGGLLAQLPAELGMPMCEVPWMVRLPVPDTPGSALTVMGFSADRYQITHPSVGLRPVVYYVGEFDQDTLTFDTPKAAGPFWLDIGDRLYAANVMEGEDDEVILWGWIQECALNSTIVHSTWYPDDPTEQCVQQGYAGALTTPRLLALNGDGILVQRLHPAVRQLRGDELYSSETGGDTVDDQGLLIELPERVPHAALTILVSRGQTEQCDLMVHRDGEQLLLQYQWGREIQAAVGTAEELDGVDLYAGRIKSSIRHFGGDLLTVPEDRQMDQLELELLLDGSVIEMYFSGGETLTTRAYQHTDSGTSKMRPLLHVTCRGSGATVDVHAWKMRSMWEVERRRQ